MSSGICENCYQNPKRRERDERGNIVIYPYCDSCNVRRHEAAQSSIFPVSSIPIPAAAPVSASTNSVKLWSERANTPIERSVVRTLQERWQSDTLGGPLIKGVYRIDLPKEIYRRFDLALQMNDGCAVTTTYYGGIASCNIVENLGSTPCNSEVCEICEVLRTAFGNHPYGISSRDGAYGSGLYTYKNPAVARSVAFSQSSSDDQEASQTNYALVQCRVAAGQSSQQSSKPYSGFIDDSGVAFCGHPASIIPTHLLIYRVASSAADPLGQSEPRNLYTKPVWLARSRSTAETKGLAKNPGSGPNATSASSLSGNRSTTKGVSSTTTAAGKTSDTDAERSASSRTGNAGASGTQQAPYQSNLESPGPGTFYVNTPSGAIPVQQAPPGVALFVMGPDGQLHPAVPAGPMNYSQIPNTLTPGTAASIGALPSPALDPATAVLRAQLRSTAPRDQRGRGRGFRLNAAAARKFVKRNAESRLDEDDDFDFDYDDDLPDHPPGHQAPTS